MSRFAGWCMGALACASLFAADQIGRTGSPSLVLGAGAIAPVAVAVAIIDGRRQ